MLGEKRNVTKKKRKLEKERIDRLKGKEEREKIN